MATEPRESASAAASSSARTGARVADRGGEFATGLISAVGNMLETTVHKVGDVGVTTMMEAARVLTTTAVGIRQTLGSVVTGNPPDFAEMERKEQELRQTRQS
jgi:hypothetical protein